MFTLLYTASTMSGKMKMVKVVAPISPPRPSSCAVSALWRTPT